MKATTNVKCHNRQIIGILPENRARRVKQPVQEAVHRVVHVVVKAGRKVRREYDLVQEGRAYKA